MTQSPIFTVAIDGPAGAGKGTLAKKLSAFFDYAHLDTGLLYRAVALHMLNDSIDLMDEAKAEIYALALVPNMLQSKELRDEAVGGAASVISAFPQVRAALLAFQRSFAAFPPDAKKGVILDGRDIGTFVLPSASCKFFITASPEVRASRRLQEMHALDVEVSFEAILHDLQERDARDAQRAVAPLRSASEAVILDTSSLSTEEVFEQARSCIEIKQKKL